jgi:hypothetical protein
VNMVLRHREEVEARGWEDVGTNICAECVIDDALMSAITNHNGAADCDYCNGPHSAPTAPIEVVVKLVVDGLRHEYEDPIEQMGWDGGYVGSVQETWDLLWYLDITENEEVHKAMADAIETTEWCQRDPYAATPAEALRWGWSAFRTFVKHERRFTFLTTDDSTADGAGTIPMHAIPAAIAASVKEAGLVCEIPAGTAWWRIRPHEPSESYSHAADIGPSPDEVARDNRMTPKGIGAFYGASTAVGARAEVAGYANPGLDGTMGRFTTTSALRVVDLQDPPAVPSLFDGERRHLRAVTAFLRGFIDDATQVASPSDWQNLEYVPTQVVAETFRYDLPADGILWRSSKDPAVASCVLFISNAEVADLGSADSGTRLVLDPASLTRLAGPI